MRKKENRRQFISKIGLVSVAAGSGFMLPVNSFGLSKISSFREEKAKLFSLSPSDLFKVLNLDLPGLAPVKKAYERKGNDAALKALLDYYRMRYPKTAGKKELSGDNYARTIEKANDLVKHVFQWGPYAAADYGPDIDWAADPAGDIEWVAAVYRFYWANELSLAYEITGDERYAQSFIELTTDWIRKHPLEKTLDIVHPVYGKGEYGSEGWKGYPWLDLQTGIRATNICSDFRIFVNSKSFTPHFLGLLLSSLYDHQVKTEKMPMGNIHNKAIFEQRGFFNVIHTFPEFRDKERWLDIAIGITCENLLAQTTSDGVQREWCGGYHSGVYRDALEIAGRASDLGREMPDYYLKRVKLMADHIFGISTPDLGFPMFGDTARGKRQSKDRKSWQLYGMLEEAGKKFGDPKYQALADLNTGQLSENGSTAFSEAGLYALRSGWTTDDVYMALHCSAPAYSSHDTADNGAFELFAYGRWLMPDTGFYTYGHDKEARAWHRQTRVHPTLTLNGKDTNIVGRQLLWKSDANQDILCFENQSYQYFIHRRTVWFSDKKGSIPFFVILDEANGDHSGDIDLHFPMAPGTVRIENESGRISTDFDDANLLVLVQGKSPLTLIKEDGWTAWEYGKREQRTSVTARYKGRGPLTFISLLVPYRGKSMPDCRITTDMTQLYAGIDPVEINVEVGGKKHTVSRKLQP